MTPIDTTRVPPRSARVEFALAAVLTVLVLIEVVRQDWLIAAILVLLGLGIATTVLDDVRRSLTGR
ncbi:hypothetical protein [Demequina lignilytica]|uniref:Uncharacterized protein n=1 Tax=Demequina lignilytica TaxID=3051663 RepID=A0AB35MK84_9MICO|nr:hypothetical protein [Demequina sp. SYSU T0a273]MDN4484045.1 hypothetical protein [Demequina sp. SYSU T0a273]